MLTEAVTPEATGGLVQFLGFDPSALGLTGFVSLIIVSIVRGWLIPRATHEAVVKAKDAEIERQRLTIVTLEARGDVLDDTVRDMVQAQASTQHAIEQLHVGLMNQSRQPIPPGYPSGPPPTSDLLGGPT